MVACFAEEGTAKSYYLRLAALHEASKRRFVVMNVAAFCFYVPSQEPNKISMVYSQFYTHAFDYAVTYCSMCVKQVGCSS